MLIKLMIRIRKMNVPKTKFASSTLFSPNRLDMIEAAPIPTALDNVITINMTGNATVNPATASTPSAYEMKKISTTLNNAITNSPTIAGIDKFHNNFDGFSVLSFSLVFKV